VDKKLFTCLIRVFCFCFNYIKQIDKILPLSVQFIYTVWHHNVGRILTEYDHVMSYLYSRPTLGRAIVLVLFNVTVGFNKLNRSSFTCNFHTETNGIKIKFITRVKKNGGWVLNLHLLKHLLTLFCCILIIFEQASKIPSFTSWKYFYYCAHKIHYLCTMR
jgi:hypothetical protein